MPPVIKIKISEVRMGLDRPEHTYASVDGLLWVTVERSIGSIYAQAPGLGRVWLTSPEISQAQQALAIRDERLERGEVGKWD